MRDVWKCCGCGAEVPNLIKTCDCMTMCAGLVGTGRHAWMAMPGDDDAPETWKKLAKHWEEIANALKRERDEARLALAAAPKAPMAEGWRTMESAPKDGTEILVCIHQYNNPNGKVLCAVVWWENDDWRLDDDTAGRAHSPICWQPLPVPPLTEGEKP